VEEVAQGGAQELTAALVAIAFAAPHDETAAAAVAAAELRRKRAALLLDKMAARLMDRILEAGGCGAARLGCAGGSVPADAAANWALHAIRFLIYNRFSGTNIKEKKRIFGYNKGEPLV
jgi:hypothetical protein